MSDILIPGDKPLRGKRILVVDDEFLILLDIQNILETAGGSVVTAGRLDEALRALNNAKPHGGYDAAVLDLKLDKDSSTPIAERLTAAGVPFVFLTGAPTDVVLAQQFALAPIVGKPFDSITLLAAVKMALAQKS